ncbi:MAG: PAS domain S-box protein [Candidatus Paceibacterota bacterium]|jgi:PAS domain S-box-containing protein
MRTFLKIIAPLVLLLFFTIIAFFVYQLELGDLQTQEHINFNNDVRSIEQIIIEQGLREYVESIQGIRGLFSASVSVERDEWASFIRSSRSQEMYPASRTFSYLKRVQLSEKDAFIKNVQNDTRVDPKGYPQFTITPEGNRTESYVVVYIEPPSSAYKVLGTDLFADPERRITIERARDTGKFAVTKIFFIDGKSYFSIYLPIYRNNAPITTIEERRAAIEGIVAETVDVNSLFASLFPQTNGFAQNGHIELFDTSQDASLSSKNLIYEFGTQYPEGITQNTDEFFIETIPFNASGISWTVRFTLPATAGFSHLEQTYPEIIGLGVVLIGILISLFLFFIITSRAKAITTAQNLFEQLKKTEQKLIETAPDMIIILNLEGKFVSANDEAQKFFGYPFGEITGKHFTLIGALQPYSVQIAENEFLKVIRGERGAPFELSISNHAGDIKEVEAHASAVIENGKIIGIQVIFRDITERKKIENALKESEEKFRVLAEQLPAMIFINKRGHVVYTNKKSEELLGYTREEFYAHSFDFRTLIAPQYLKETEKDFELHMQGKNVPLLEYELVTKTGRHITAIQSTRLIRFEGESAILGIVTDISQTKAIQQQLALQLAITKAIAESTTVSEAIQKSLENIGTIFKWQLGAFWKVEENNTLICTNSWHAPNETRSSIFEIASHKLVLKKGDGFLRTIWNDKKPIWIPNILECKDFIRKKEASALNLHNALGFPIKTKNEVVGIFEFFAGENIREPGSEFFETLAAIGEQFSQFLEKINTQEELKRHFVDIQKFQWAVESTSDHIIITDTDGIIQYANKASETTTGYSVKEVLGTKVGALWGHHMPKEYYTKLWETLKVEKKTFSGEVENRRKNGENYTAALSISPIFDEQGNEKLFVAIERDITKEREIDRAKSEFVSLASHQLRTPLTAINWYAEMLESGDEGFVNEKQRAYLQEIMNSGRRLVNLVNALLNVSRIELGTFAIEPTSSDIVAVCKSALKELESQITERNITLKTSFDESLPPLNIDERLMNMILQNLLSNAVGYTPKGGAISVSIEKDDEVLLITVTDNGIGIPTASQAKIFTKLYRADNAHEAKPDGTGLGLYIVKAVVDNAGGKIWFDSKEGKGTSFYVTIPLKGMRPKEGIRGLIPIS